MDNERPNFIGRNHEFALLVEECGKAGAHLIVIHGRRRVGKTRLVTEFFKGSHMWKFDGVEGRGKVAQIKNALDILSSHTGDGLYRSVKCTSWLEFVKLLDRAISGNKHGHRMTLFFDELPYMCCRKRELVGALKWAWDNLWQDKDGFNLVLCGSVASFMVKQVVRSSALYGRIKIEISLKPLHMPELLDFFGGKRSVRELCDLYMFCGGIPEYLLQIRSSESISQNIARLAFCKDGYFVHEFDRLFKDIFEEERIYKRIIILLARYKSLKVPEMTELLKLSGGGGFAEYLDNLEAAGFVRSITPWDRQGDTKLKRYRLDDEYLLYYFKFVHPNLRRIDENTDAGWALKMLHGREYKAWARFAFERLCLKHVCEIMKLLKIDQLVKNYGAYFNRATNTKDGCQIDLLFERHDPVVTLCEMKYHDGLIGKWVMEEVERKAALIGSTKKSVEKVLITTEGVTKDLADAHFFSRVILIDELFQETGRHKGIVAS